MRRTVVLRPEVQGDVDDAYDWYEERSAGLGDEFPAAVRSAVVGLEHDAESYGFLRRDIRKATPRFPFVIYYRILGDQVEVIAILHGHRNPRRWKRRS